MNDEKQNAYAEGFTAGKQAVMEMVRRELLLGYKTYKHHFEDTANAIGDLLTIIERKENDLN